MKRALLVVGALLLAATPVRAEGSASGRDPMRPPQRAGLTAGTSASAEAAPALATVRQLLVVEGRRYVIDAGRRRAVGDLLGDARIERIEDSAVIVRRAGQVQRLPLFAGVTKKASPEPALATSAPSTAPSAAASSAATRTALAAAAARTPSTRR